MEPNDHDDETDELPAEQAVKAVIRERDEGEGVPRGAVSAYAAAHYDHLTESVVNEAADALERAGEIYESRVGLRILPEAGDEGTELTFGHGNALSDLDDATDEDVAEAVETVEEPETLADATASGLGLAAVRTLLERFHDGRAPREELVERLGEETVETAVRKGAIREDGDDLVLTPAEELRDAETYAEARGDEPTVALGTLSTVLGVVEACDYPDSPATREQVLERAGFDEAVVDDALGALMRRGKVYTAEPNAYSVRSAVEQGVETYRGP